MSLLEQALDNLGALVGLHRMHVSPGWAHDRLEAALEAERRIQRYRAERVKRLEMYIRGGAREFYRRRWSSRGLIVAIRGGDPFTRAVGSDEGGSW